MYPALARCLFAFGGILELSVVSSKVQVKRKNEILVSVELNAEST
jgi:hypothetical protein